MRSVITRRAFSGGMLVMLTGVPAAADGHMDAASAIALLRAGGLNIYMRHAITDRSQIDTGRLHDRAGQRNLSTRGRAQAAALGQALVRLGIPIGSVATSAVYRASDTAELVFGQGRAAIIDELVADDYTPRDPAVDAAAVARRLARRPVQGNDVFVGHIVPFGLIVGRSFTQAQFPEGALGIVRPGDTRFELIGVVTAETLITAAGLAAP